MNGSAVQVSAPTAQIDSADHDFAISAVHERVDLANDAIHFERAALPADVGNDTEGAAVVASILYFEVRARALVGGIEDRRGQQFRVGENVGNEKRPVFDLRSLGIGGESVERYKRGLPGSSRISQDNFGELMLVGVADDQIHARQCRNFLGRALRVTSGDDNAGVRILPAHSSDCGPRVLIGARRDRARIQNHNGGLGPTGGASQTLLFELAFESGTIGLCGATAEVLYKESRHN